MKFKRGNFDFTRLVLEYKRMSDTSSDFLLCNAPSEQVDIKIDNSEHLIEQNDDPFYVYDDNDALKGTYYLFEAPSKYYDVVTLKMFDSMIKAETNYDSKLQYPSRVGDQLDEISRITGLKITVNDLSSATLDQQVNFWDNTISIRSYLKWIAELEGKFPYSSADGSIRFRGISQQADWQTQDISDYEIDSVFTISRVCFDNGILLADAGDMSGQTIYLSNNNPYIDSSNAEIIVDNILSLYGGMSFYSATKITAAGLDDLHSMDVVSYGDMKFLCTSFTSEYKGGTFQIQTLDAKLNSKNMELASQKYDPAVKIKNIEVNLDKNNQSLEIISKEQEGLTNKVSELEVDLEGIDLKVESATENIYKFEVGSGNIFENCRNYLQKDSTETGVKQKSDMPLGINADYLRGKDIVISVDINVRHGIIGNLGNYIGAEFDVFYKDGTRKTYSTKWYLGQYLMQYLIQTDVASNDERLWTHFKIDDKEVASTSNLRMIIAFDCEYAMASNPKVEFGKTPTSFLYDMDSIRDNITTIQKEYTEISTKVSELNLKAVSMEEQITTIDGEMDKVTTRLQSAEIKLQPTNIVMAINDKIGADGKLYTTKFTLDKTGVHIKGGGLDISNNSGTKVFYADTAGNLVINNLTAINGNFSGKIASTNISGGNISATTITGSTINGNTITGGTISGTNISGSNITGGNIRVTSDLYIGNNLFLGEQSSSQMQFYKKFMFSKTDGIISSKENLGYGQIIIQSSDIATLMAGDNMVGSSYNATVSCVYGALSLYSGSEITANKQIKVTSDRRLKKDIKDIDLTSILKDVCVKSFRYRDGNTLSTGVIAQDLEDNPLRHYVLSYPELIGIRPNKKRKRRYAVNYQTIFLAAVQEVQKLRKEINELRMEVK